MNFKDYFSSRNELIIRLLVEVPDAVSTRPDQRFVGIGVVCLTSAVLLEVWASYSLEDPGYFARASSFLEVLLLAGLGLIIAAKLADVWLARLKIRTRERLKERTVTGVISADGAIASKLADQVR